MSGSDPSKLFFPAKVLYEFASSSAPFYFMSEDIVEIKLRPTYLMTSQIMTLCFQYQMVLDLIVTGFLKNDEIKRKQTKECIR